MSEASGQAVLDNYAGKKEIAAWAMYDVANSTYTTIVVTAIYNAYFVKVIAGSLSMSSGNSGLPTLLLSLAVCVSSVLVVFSAPVIGAVADATAGKKRLLFYTTALCLVATAGLAMVPPGQYIVAMIILIVGNAAFGTGEDLIAAFLPELAPRERLGRISAVGWASGYMGALMSLGLALSYVSWAQGQGQTSSQFVPVVMLLCAFFYMCASAPTFIVLKERAIPVAGLQGQNLMRIGFARLRHTIAEARQFRDLFSLLLAILVYQCGVGTVVNLAGVYAQEVLKFSEADALVMILVVNLTAALGALVFGHIQDRLGSVRTLCLTMGLWLVAIVMALLSTDKAGLWLAANVVGAAMGASGSAGRALVSKFSPPERAGEFLGLWGVAVKLATAIGVLTFGVVSVVGGYRPALLVTSVFFISGFLLLLRINEERGLNAARANGSA